jgi:phosphoglycerate dehydrogenase-like enzyme
MRAILLGPESYPYASVLGAKLRSAWQLCGSAHVEHEKVSQHLAGADALISCRFDASFPAMPNLKLLQAPATGINAIEMNTVPPHVPVCNAYGHEIAIAEYVIWSMLSCTHKLLQAHTSFVDGQWYWSQKEVHPTHAEIYGKKLCIIGLGKIGRETARRAKALGMHVIACNRTVRTAVCDVDQLAGLAAIAECAAEADFVLVACALSSETINIVDARVLAAMKQTAYVINVARGALISEPDLYRALQSHQIAGAVLDAWYHYPSLQNPHPAPSDFPFSELDNVIMTPHISGWTDGMVDRRWSEIAANLDNLALNRPLINVVRAADAAAPPPGR